MTGIQNMRHAQMEKEAPKTSKRKLRDKHRPKTGDIDIDFQILHDAFYKYQTKPTHLTLPGQLYFEGKELPGIAAIKE